MSSYKTYQIENEGHKPFTFKVKAESRFHETLQKLIAGPVSAPALTRRSDHILNFRKAGIAIETEMRKQKDDGSERYGVYHLISKVTPVIEVAA